MGMCLACPKECWNTVNTPYSLTSRKIVVVKLMLTLFGQLRWGYGFQSRSTHRLNSAANAPRRRGFHEEPSNVSSLGSSATFDIAWRSSLDLPPESTDGRFRQYVAIQRERGVVGIQSMREELGHGLLRKDVRINSESVTPFIRFTPLSTFPRFPRLCRNQSLPPFFSMSPLV